MGDRCDRGLLYLPLGVWMSRTRQGRVAAAAALPRDLKASFTTLITCTSTHALRTHAQTCSVVAVGYVHLFLVYKRRNVKPQPHFFYGAGEDIEVAQRTHAHHRRDNNNHNLQAFQLIVGQVPTRCA